MGLTYQDAGVDPEKAGNILSNFAKYQKSRPKDPNVLSGIGPFASCFALKDILVRYADPILVTSCDGVGTKAMLALEWEHISTLGHDLVAMNVNDLLCVGALPFLFLDYYACGRLEENQLTPLLKSIQDACEMSHCSLVGGETAEMPGLYRNADFDLAGFTVGLVDRENILGSSKIKAGDVLVAISSSGLHSNGYSLVRKIVERESISPNAKVPFGDQAKTWKEVLLAPTTIYVSALKDILKDLHGLAHLTGGGLFENLPRILPEGHVAVIEQKSWEFSELFTWLQEKAGISSRELLSTFNCGVGMIAALSPDHVSTLIDHVRNKSLRAWPIGQVEERKGTAPIVEWRE